LVAGSAGLLMLASCKKDEQKVSFNGGTAPILTASVSDSIPLHPQDSTQTAVTFNWTNPNYSFSDGISSLNVTYYLQIDTAGANFSSSNMQTVAFTSVLGTSFTVTAFNALLGNGMLLAFGQPHQIQVRIKSFLAPYTSSTPAAAPLYSSVLSYTVVPYAPPPKLAPPKSGSLYIVGSAVAVSGWNNPISPASQVPIQQFTAMSSTDFKLTIPLVGGGEYKLIAVDGSWTDQWSVATADDPTEVNGGPFVYNGANALAPATSATYDIDVNFQTGLFSVKLH
jgi:hypothetical protein